MSPKPSDVVVTGVGAVTSIGIGIGPFWESLRLGRSGVCSLERRDDGGPRPPCGWRDSARAGNWIGGPILGFDAAQYVRPRKALKVMGRELQTAFSAAAMAIDQAALATAMESELVPCDQIATIFGSQMLYGPASELLDAVKASTEAGQVCDITRFGSAAMRDIMPLWMLKYLPNMAACHVGISIGATGPNNTIVAGDVSATSAMMESVGALARGAATAVVCGATGSRIDETYLVYRGDSPVASVREDISESSRPHAVDADGVVPAEAAAALVIESRQSAANREVTPLATVAGHASRFRKPQPDTRGSRDAVAMAIRGALTSAGMTADEIGLVVSHAIGDPQQDREEEAAILQTLPGVPICMPAAITGHSGAAMGAVYMVAAVLALMHRTIPATPKHGDIRPALASHIRPASTPMAKPAVVVLTHTSHGVANAVVLRD
ncbi:MAG: beta-ketoacyl synthase N-terminal-like domain-containing protein [Planctomycetaceae bacterium]